MRIEGKCCGDCSKCKLLEDGKVDMIPCAIDQIFQRVQKIENKLSNKEINIAGSSETN